MVVIINQDFGSPILFYLFAEDVDLWGSGIAVRVQMEEINLWSSFNVKKYLLLIYGVGLEGELLVFVKAICLCDNDRPGKKVL